jgi:GH24 family phage-related lysozyme (muramidase)
MTIDPQGEQFIVEEETGGKQYYEQVYNSTFIWPGGSSGPTALVGIDIGYYTTQEIDDIFKPMTSTAELALIQGGRGKCGELGEAYTKKLKKINFTWEEALNVFKTRTLPKFTKLTEKTFPGVNDLCSSAQTAILSLVFNRGTSLRGSTRAEMLEIQKLIPSKDYKAIAAQIRSMKRLWNKGSGLLGRRDREALLVESCLG